jgi:hypothetical protein
VSACDRRKTTVMRRNFHAIFTLSFSADPLH